MANIQKVSSTPVLRQENGQAESKAPTANAPELAQRSPKQLPLDQEGEHIVQSTVAPTLRGRRGFDAGLLNLEQLLGGLPSKLDGK